MFSLIGIILTAGGCRKRRAFKELRNMKIPLRRKTKDFFLIIFFHLLFFFFYECVNDDKELLNICI